ncbi:glycosyltransferase family 2 protein [Pelagicoccus sp. SDUM812005]|uniref:glycosyltransferase family 2 protein n=1 Tax=Pelagicoccus sp. SDUM812005 TaxID=3041257 RepID=UPI00280E3802|nr:glycosyltransferase family 2 protein [Pelagicoccus sp. SDUM812005]MDQ8181908.1 glycosyltransferase family 2 protein [Pelagicoccus sp. SDUM812005]
MPNPKISVVVPAFNEEKSIAACLQELTTTLPADTEFLVVDGGSDQTAPIVRQAEAKDSRIRYCKNVGDRGKGHAIRTGIALARGDIIAFFDADLQFFSHDLLKLAEFLLEGHADVAIGSRFHPESPKDVKASLVRNCGNWLVSAYLSLLYGQRVTDALAGVKALTREAAGRIDLQSDSFEYEVEIIAKSLRHKLHLSELTIGTRNRAAGNSKVSVFQVGARILFAITRFRFERANP